METLRLGGMALANGVLVHGPAAWGAAVRTPQGELRVASGRKRRFGARVQAPFLRGPLRLAEAFAVLPDLRRALPEARFPFAEPRTAVTVVAATVATAAARRSRLGTVAGESLAALASLAPAVVGLRGGDLAAYHGAEHLSIGAYESGAAATKEHERCGSHLVGPLLLTSALASALAGKVPARRRTPARALGALGAVGVAVEIFAWMDRNPRHPLARALARPGHELQARVSTAEPSAEQLEVAQAALAACLRAERHGAGVQRAEPGGAGPDGGPS